MKAGWLAAGLSLGAHGALLLLFAHRSPLAHTATPSTPRVEVEVLRLAGLVTPRSPREESRGVPEAPRSPREQSPTPSPGEQSPAPSLQEQSPSPSPQEQSPSRSPREQSRGVPSGFAPLETAGGDPAAAEQLGDPAPGAEAKSFDLGPLHRRLAAAARSCYPKAASRFRVAGSAQVRFCLGAGGEVTAAVIDTSSGNGLLDAAATGCVVPGAAPFEVELAGQCFTLPVRFTP